MPHNRKLLCVTKTPGAHTHTHTVNDRHTTRTTHKDARIQFTWARSTFTLTCTLTPIPIRRLLAAFEPPSVLFIPYNAILLPMLSFNEHRERERRAHSKNIFNTRAMLLLLRHIKPARIGIGGSAWNGPYICDTTSRGNSQWDSFGSSSAGLLKGSSIHSAYTPFGFARTLCSCGLSVRVCVYTHAVYSTAIYLRDLRVAWRRTYRRVRLISASIYITLLRSFAARSFNAFWRTRKGHCARCGPRAHIHSPLIAAVKLRNRNVPVFM